MPERVKEKLVDVFMHLDEHISYKEEYGVLFDTPFCEAVETVLQMLKNGVTVPGDKDINVPTKWISVKDRLPDTECLAVSMLTGPAYEEMLVGYVAEASNWDTGYECESDGEILPNVTHWMPLPQPPKGE